MLVKSEPNAMRLSTSLTLVCLFLGFTANAVVAQSLVSPPENAKILVSGSTGVLLEWPGSSKGTFFVQVYAGQVAAVEQEVTGTSVIVPLRAGLGYQWKVSAMTAGGYQPVVPSRNFQVLADSEFVFPGRDGVSPSRSSRRSNYGAPGSLGTSGPNLTATLHRVGPYITLDITGAPITKNFVITPGASPITLISRGGRGGDGNPGQPGQDAAFDYQTGYIYPAESGGPGGDAGDGGTGGSLTAVGGDTSLDPRTYLNLVSQGGQPGQPGEGGLGGRSVPIPSQWLGRQLPQGYGYGNTYIIANGRPGRPGRPGRVGPNGQVFVR